MQANIIIVSVTTTGQKKLNTTISDVNPTATNQQLKTLGEALNNFTTNNYVQTIKETKEEL